MNILTPVSFRRYAVRFHNWLKLWKFIPPSRKTYARHKSNYFCGKRLKINTNVSVYKSYTALSTLERGRKAAPLIKLSVARSASERRVGIASPTLIRRGGGSWLDRFWHDTSAKGWQEGEGVEEREAYMYSPCTVPRVSSRVLSLAKSRRDAKREKRVGKWEGSN